MYEAAISQVYTLCSHIGVGYDGVPSGFSAANGGTDTFGQYDMQVVRVRIYWCKSLEAFLNLPLAAPAHLRRLCP